jgi:hypothetical protein
VSRIPVIPAPIITTDGFLVGLSVIFIHPKTELILHILCF